MSEKTDRDFAQGLGNFLQRIASVITAFAIVGALLWALAKPYTEDYVNGLLEPLHDEIVANTASLEKNSQQLADINEELQEVQQTIGSQKPVVEFFSPGIVARNGPFMQGGTVPIEYQLRRNSSCPTQVVVQFKSQSQRRIITSSTYVIPATPAEASFQPRTFIVDVTLPLSLPPGWYSYQPILRPDRVHCPGQEDIPVPPSLYFEVIAKG